MDPRAARLQLAILIALVIPYDTAPPAVQRLQDAVRPLLERHRMAAGCAQVRASVGSAQCHDPRCVRCFGADALPSTEG